MSFTHADVQNILKLLEASHFDELMLEMEGVKLQLRRHGAGNAAMATAGGAGTAAASTAPPPGAAGSAMSPSSPAPNAPHPSAGSPAEQITNTPHLLEIRAPMLGTFFRSPKPGAEPFVAVGSQVQADTVIGIIEVMKLMNSATAGVSGEIVEILAQDGELVEYDQPLMRVRA